MKNENSVIAILAAAGGALCSYGAKLVVPLAVLLLVMVADYVSGMAKAWSTGTLCSKIGLRGILKKLGYLVLVGVAGVVDWLRSGADRRGGDVPVFGGGNGDRVAHYQRAALHSGECGRHRRAGACVPAKAAGQTEKRGGEEGEGRKCRSLK